MKLLFLGSIGLPEIIVLVLIVLLIFGGKKIPELMKGLGKGVRSFKEGMKGLEDEESELRDAGNRNDVKGSETKSSVAMPNRSDEDAKAATADGTVKEEK